MLADARVAATLPVVDMDGAREFYEETLGLEIFYQNEIVVAYACGRGTMLTLYRRDTPTRADHTAAGWIVDDVEEAVREMGDRGVVFERYDLPDLKTDERGIVAGDVGKTAWFKDPEGNILSIAELPEGM